MSAARFITLEGGEGTGKTTQARALAAWLEARGLPVLATREPGGTAGGEAIRSLLLEGTADRWEPLAELMLVNAARLDHMARLVGPALAAGTWVVCDRYVDSTRVYQGLVGGVGRERVDRLHGEFLGLPWPDLTLVLDLPAAAGMARRHEAGDLTRFERKGAAYHERVRAGFAELAALEPGRVLLVDADAPPELVTRRLVEAAAGRLGLVCP